MQRLTPYAAYISLLNVDKTISMNYFSAKMTLDAYKAKPQKIPKASARNQFLVQKGWLRINRRVLYEVILYFNLEVASSTSIYKQNSLYTHILYISLYMNIYTSI